jgi:hypothetical protein
MGTDVYLHWRKMSKADHKAQITGWSITAGNKGYLRASIGMVEENMVLRMVFPHKYWQGDVCKDPYDFVGNSVLVVNILREYLNGKMRPELIPDNTELQKMKEMDYFIRNMVGATGGEIITNDKDETYKRVWAKSLFDFFLLAMEKQNAGLYPYPEISW